MRGDQTGFSSLTNALANEKGVSTGRLHTGGGVRTLWSAFPARMKNRDLLEGGGCHCTHEIPPTVGLAQLGTEDASQGDSLVRKGQDKWCSPGLVPGSGAWGRPFSFSGPAAPFIR